MNTPDNLLITVVIPTRDIAGFLPAALQSVVEQGGQWQVVGVDSASTDGTRAIWAEFQAKYPDRVQVLDEPKCRLAEAVNVGIVAAKPGLIQWIGGDDRVAPGAHAHVRAAAAAHPGAGWFAGNCCFVDENGNAIITGKASPWDLSRMIDENRYFAAATVFDRHFAIRAGLTSPALPRNMDYEFWFRLAWLEPPVVVDETLAFFTMRKDAISGSNHALARTRESLRIARFYAQTWREKALWQQIWLQRWVPLWTRDKMGPVARPVRNRLRALLKG